jgi:hypothetical protein
MNKVKPFALLCIAAALSITACQKDTAPRQDTVTKEKLTGTYKVTSLKLKVTSGAEENLFSILPDCEKASTQALNIDFSWNRHNACDPADNETSTWAYIDNKQIVINGLLCNIAAFDGKNLVLTFKDFMGMQGTLTETLTKQ